MRRLRALERGGGEGAREVVQGVSAADAGLVVFGLDDVGEGDEGEATDVVWIQGGVIRLFAFLVGELRWALHGCGGREDVVWAGFLWGERNFGLETAGHVLDDLR